MSIKLSRPHPLVTATMSTTLVAITCATVMMWGGVTPSPSDAEPPATAHRAAIVPATHVDRSPQNGPIRRIRYATPNPDPRQNYADLYLPADDARRGDVPVVVLVHGGSWASGVSARSFDRLARDLTARGLAVYNVEYRRVGSGGGWPTTFTDVGAALDELPADDRGPHLGATTWTPRRVVSVSGPLDMTWSAEHGDNRVVRVLGGTPATEASRYRAVDPMQIVGRRDTARAPEFIALHGTADHLVSDTDSVRFVEAYRAHGGRARLQLLPGQSHTSMFRTHSSAYLSLVQTIVDAATAP